MVTYDYNTGKPLAPGQAQSVYNTQTGQKIGDPIASPYVPTPSKVPTQTPTVVSDTTIRDTVIPEIKAKAQSSLPPTGVKIGPNGEWIDTRTYQKPQDTSSTTPNAPTAGAYGDDLTKMLADLDKTEPELSESEKTLFDLQQKMLDESSKSTINQIRSKYADRYKQLQTSQGQSTNVLKNTLNIAGSGRYAPISSTNVLSVKEKDDIQTLNDLADEENQLILQAQSAKSQGDMKLLSEKLALFEKKKQEKTDLAVKIADKMNEYNKELRTAKAKEEEDINSAILDAAKGGAPKDVLEAAKAAGSLVGAVSALGDYLNTTSGIVGEYNFYKRQAIASGVTPKSFEEYQDADANRKKIAAGASGLPTSVVTQVDKLSSAFDTAPITKQFNEAVNKKLTFDSIIERGVGGPSDLALVYEFMKALDPTSVVRETEYETARKSGNIFSGIYAKYNGYLKENGGFLPPAVKNEFNSIVNQKLDVVKAQYDNLRKEQARKINMKTGMDDGLDYLTDYASPLGNKIIDEQKNAQSIVDDYYLKLTDPKERAFIDELEAVLKDDEAVADYLRKTGKISFKPVGGDTNLASGIVAGYDIKSYATDPTHEKKIASLYSNIPPVSNVQSIDSYIKSVAPKSPVTGNMIVNAANKYGVDPKMMLAIMIQDSTLGTKGLATKTFNPGNVGNTDDGSTKNYGSWEKGVEAVAKNLQWRKVNSNIS